MYGLLSDFEIERYCVSPVPSRNQRGRMIEPFEPGQIRACEYGDQIVKAISFGTSSYGYDFRLSAENFKIFRNPGHIIVDPKNFDDRLLEPAELHVGNQGMSFVIPGNSYALGETVEHVHMPHDVTAVGIGKSTYARCGLIMNVTPLEAGWSGVITLELSNSSPAPLRVYVNEGICQCLFIRGEYRCRTSYADKAGKYQNQQGMTTAKV